MDDLISREDAIDAIYEHEFANWCDKDEVSTVLNDLPAAQPEPLTDKEQRIFLAAMRREEKICEEVDRNYVREPYEDSLMRVCKEIVRKVKGALWT
jgi:hypothetical protein